MTERGLSDSELTKAIKASQPSVFQWFNAPKGKNTTSMIRGDNLIAVSRPAKRKLGVVSDKGTVCAVIDEAPPRNNSAIQPAAILAFRRPRTG